MLSQIHYRPECSAIHGLGFFSPSLVSVCGRCIQGQVHSWSVTATLSELVVCPQELCAHLNSFQGERELSG